MSRFQNRFDYKRLDHEQKAAVQECADEIRLLMRRSVQDIISIGRKLIKVKRYLGYGHFGDWLAAEFEWSERTAQNYMMVARRFKSEIIADLSFEPTSLIRLASMEENDPVYCKAMESARSGKHISPKFMDEIAGDLCGEGQILDKQIGFPRASDEKQVSSFPDSTSEAANTDNLPPILRAFVDERILGERAAELIACELEQADSRVQTLVTSWGLQDPELVPLLSRLARADSTTFNEILASGHIPSDEPISIARANRWNLETYLARKHREYRMAGGLAKQQEGQRNLEQKLTDRRNHDRTQVIVTDSMEELINTEDQCLAYFTPGSISPAVIGKFMVDYGYKPLAVVMFRGDPNVNVDSKIVPAGRARFRIPEAAEDFMEGLCALGSKDSNSEEQEPNSSPGEVLGKRGELEISNVDPTTCGSDPRTKRIEETSRLEEALAR